VTAAPAAGSAPPAAPPRPGLASLAAAGAAPLICAAALTALLSAWVATGGAGTITRVRIQFSLAAVPMRAYTAQAAAARNAAATYLTIRNLSAAPDELVAARSPICRRVVLTRRAGASGSSAVVPGLAVPARGTLTLSPFGDDVVLTAPAPFESDMTIPLTLTFRHAGEVTVQAAVTAPGVP